MVFINLEKTYDRALRYLILWVWNKRNVPSGYIEIIKYMYEEAVTSMRTTCREIGEVSVIISLHQESTHDADQKYQTTPF